MNDTPARLSSHEKEQRRNDLRRLYMTYTADRLADMVNMIAREPRRLDPIEKQALLMTVANRLRDPNGTVPRINPAPRVQ